MLDNVLGISVCAVMNPVGLEQSIYDDYAKYKLQFNDGLLPFACNSIICDMEEKYKSLYHYI